MNYPIDDEIARIESDYNSAYETRHGSHWNKFQYTINDVGVLLDEIKFLRKQLELPKSQRATINPMFKQDEN